MKDHGEKIHEEMITSSDSYTTYDLGRYYVILPMLSRWDKEEFKKFFKAQLVKEGFNAITLEGGYLSWGQS